MELTVKEQIDVLLHEHRQLIERDQRLTSFYHRFVTIGATFIGAVIYYATVKPVVYHAVPFLIPLLMLFVEYWRMDTVATNSYLAKIEERVNMLAGQKLLVYKRIKMTHKFFSLHDATSTKTFNPGYTMSAIMAIAFAVIITISYYKIAQYFSVNEVWKGWFVIYCVTNGCLQLYTWSVVFYLEKGRIYKFWRGIADHEYTYSSSDVAR